MTCPRCDTYTYGRVRRVLFYFTGPSARRSCFASRVLFLFIGNEVCIHNTCYTALKERFGWTQENLCSQKKNGVTYAIVIYIYIYTSEPGDISIYISMGSDDDSDDGVDCNLLLLIVPAQRSYAIDGLL